MILLPMRNVWEVNLSALLKKYVLMNKGKFLHMGVGVGEEPSLEVAEALQPRDWDTLTYKKREEATCQDIYW